MSDLYKINLNALPEELKSMIPRRASELTAIEIKSCMTPYPKIFDELKYWYEISGNTAEKGYVVYGGDENQFRLHGTAVSWKQLEALDI